MINSGITVVLDGLAIRNGRVSGSVGGGGLYNGGMLTFSNGVVSGNSARLGGGLFSAFEAVTLSNSTVSGNATLGDGAGFYSFSGSASVVDSTIRDNFAGTSGGGVCPGTLTVTGSTLSGNSAGTGVRQVMALSSTTLE
ncbi:MAG: hypothetical protein U0841_23370 [Chloroflexia bacterium]